MSEVERMASENHLSISVCLGLGTMSKIYTVKA